jgi:16S rRNA (guanine527-N7)-methyltransferase
MDVAYIQTYLNKLPFAVPAEMAAQLSVLLGMLVKWNKAYNLTAIRDSNEMLTHHVLDSLSITPYIEGKHVLDVGTGPGFPGLPLALMMPDKHFYLLDSNAKKTRFIQQVILELGLTNVNVITSRIEDYTPDKAMDTVVSRAFSSLAEFVQKTSRFCVKKGLLIAMKGRYPTQELSILDTGSIPEVVKITVPDLEAERHLVLIRL